MNDTIAEWLSTAVEVCICAGIMSGLILIMSSAHTLSTTLTEQEAVAAEMRYYREYNGYDHTHVYQGDAITAIFKGRGMPEIYVKSSKGNYEWTEDSAPCPYTAREIAALIAPDVVYDADLEKSPNGEVIGITFEPHSSSCTGR